MATPEEEYFPVVLDHLNELNRCHDRSLSSNCFQQTVIRVVEEEEEYSKSNVKNVTTDTSFRSPVAINAQKKDTNLSYERRLALGILAETIKEFKGYTIKSTLSDSAQYDSDK